MKTICLQEILAFQDHVHNLTPQEKCWMIDQDTGTDKQIKSADVLNHIFHISKPLFQTDDDGMLEVVTLNIHYDYTDDNLQSGKLITMNFHRSDNRFLQKRIQPYLNSDGVGAPRLNDDCIPHFINNLDRQEA